MKEFVFAIAKEKLMKGEINLATATIKCMLLQGTTPAVSITNLTGLTECNAVGYSRKTLANITVVKNNTDNKVVVDSDNVYWNTITTATDITGALYYVDVDGTDANASPLSYSERDFPVAVNGGRLEIAIDNLLTTQESKENDTVDILVSTVTTDAEKVTALKTLYGVS